MLCCAFIATVHADGDTIRLEQFGHFFFCGRCINARTRFQILSVTCVETRFCFLGRVLKEATCVEIQFCFLGRVLKEATCVETRFCFLGRAYKEGSCIEGGNNFKPSDASFLLIVCAIAVWSTCSCENFAVNHVVTG